jgi:hypothetical protein
MFLPEEETPPSKNCKDLADYLKLYCLIFLLLVIGKCFVLGPLQLLSDLLACLVLFFGATSFDYCYLTMFVFLTFYCVVDLINRLGILVQRGIPLLEAKLILRTVVACLALVLYFVGWWLTLIAYREFKAASLGMLGQIRTDPERERLNNDEENAEAEIRRRDGNSGRGFEAFQGRGIAVG